MGALLSGLVADNLGIPSAMLAVAALTFLSGIIVAGVMYETLTLQKLAILAEEHESLDPGRIYNLK